MNEEKTVAEETPEQKRVRELKAQLAAQRAARDAAKAPERAKNAVERLEQQIKDEAGLAKAQDAHGEANVMAVESASGLVVVKRDNHLQFKRYMDRGKFGTKENEELIARCLVYPSADALDGYIEKEPFLIQALAGAIGKLAGASADEFVGK